MGASLRWRISVGASKAARARVAPPEQGLLAAEQSPARPLALVALLEVRQPDRRHEVTAREPGRAPHASMRSVLHANGANPVTFCASATSSPADGD
jgi:hypothetical protein